MDLPTWTIGFAAGLLGSAVAGFLYFRHVRRDGRKVRAERKRRKVDSLRSKGA
jgi:hypothetical protein